MSNVNHIAVRMVGRNPENPSDRRSGIYVEQRLEIIGDRTCCLSTAYKDNLILEMLLIKQATQTGYIEMDSGGVADLSFPTSKTRRGRVEERGQICPTITTTGGLYRITVDGNDNDYAIRIRKLTETEMFLLMGMKTDDVDNAMAVGVSSSQVRKLAGNGLISNCITSLAEHLYKAQYDPNYECGDERILWEQELGL